MTITVYSKPSCVQCNQTKKVLNNMGLEYNELDLTADEQGAKLQEFKDLGLAAAPIVEVDGQVWSGFRPDRLKALKTEEKEVAYF